MRTIRDCYPRRLRVYWVQDGRSANWPPDVREFADAYNIELVLISTYASYLNRIEAHFRLITEVVVDNADYLNWDSFAHALARRIQHRNGPEGDHRIWQLERKLTVLAA